MRKPRFSFVLLLVHLLFLQFTHRISGIRKDASLQDKRICRTTAQGRYLLSDDNGRVCDALSVDPNSGCCSRRREQFACQGCNPVAHCCNSYEYCVSCCQNPEQTQKEQALKVKLAKAATAGTYLSVFEFCAGRCRHNSDSVVHENAYSSDFHHCFSIPSNSSETTNTNMEARLAGISIIIGRQGESCNSACKSNEQLCVPNKLSLLNQCEVYIHIQCGELCAGTIRPNGNLVWKKEAIFVGILTPGMYQKYMNCKGACLASVGADQPAEVVNDAPRHMNPGACLYTKTESILSCDGFHSHTRRLCPCA